MQPLLWLYFYDPHCSVLFGLHNFPGIKVRELLLVSEVPIFKFQAHHTSWVCAFKHNVIWEERGLEQAFGLI